VLVVEGDLEHGSRENGHDFSFGFNCLFGHIFKKETGIFWEKKARPVAGPRFASFGGTD
jgi:hypothetical protein